MKINEVIIIAQATRPLPVKNDLPLWYVTSLVIPLIISIAGSVLTLMGGYFLGRKLGLFNAKLTKENQESTAKDVRIKELEEKVETLSVITAVQGSEARIKSHIDSVKTDLETKIESVKTDLSNVNDNLERKIDETVNGATISIRKVLDNHESRIVQLEASTSN